MVKAAGGLAIFCPRTGNPKIMKTGKEERSFHFCLIMFSRRPSNQLGAGEGPKKSKISKKGCSWGRKYLRGAVGFLKKLTIPGRRQEKGKGSLSRGRGVAGDGREKLVCKL